MKYLFFGFVLFNVMALQPYNRKFSPCNIVGYYYKNGKFIATNNWGDRSIITGGAIANSVFMLKGKQIQVDSVVFKIK